MVRFGLPESHRPTIAVFVARNTTCASVNAPFPDLFQLKVIKGLWSEHVYGDASVVLKVTLRGVPPECHGVSCCQGYDEHGLWRTLERGVGRWGWDCAHILSFHEVEIFPCPNTMKCTMVYCSRRWHQDRGIRSGRYVASTIGSRQDGNIPNIESSELHPGSTVDLYTRFLGDRRCIVEIRPRGVAKQPCPDQTAMGMCGSEGKASRCSQVHADEEG